MYILYHIWISSVAYRVWSMWETSKMEAFSRVCKWEANMPIFLYWTGIEYPAKGTILPPCCTWKSYKAVFFSFYIIFSKREYTSISQFPLAALTTSASAAAVAYNRRANWRDGVISLVALISSDESKVGRKRRTRKEKDRKQGEKRFLLFFS